MKHVTHRLEAWLGGELGEPEATELEAHLAACQACRADADDLRDVWESLGVTVPAAVTTSTWPAVRARTFGKTNGGWFFGGTPALQAGLVTCAVAMGLLAAILLPGGGTSVADEAEDAGFWLDGTSWASDEADALDNLWLAAADDQEAGP